MYLIQVVGAIKGVEENMDDEFAFDIQEAILVFLNERYAPHGVFEVFVRITEEQTLLPIRGENE